jgi:hypothetical protein
MRYNLSLMIVLCFCLSLHTALCCRGDFIIIHIPLRLSVAKTYDFTINQYFTD